MARFTHPNKGRIRGRIHGEVIELTHTGFDSFRSAARWTGRLAVEGNQMSARGTYRFVKGLA